MDIPSTPSLIVSSVAMIFGWFYIQKFMREWLLIENNMIAMTLASLLAWGVGGVADWVFPMENGELTACAMDARICPDGSAVARQGEFCQFSPCPPVVKK